MTVDISVTIEYDSKIDTALKKLAKEEKNYDRKSGEKGFLAIEKTYTLRDDVHSPAALVFILSGESKLIDFFTNGIYWDERRNKKIIINLINWVKEKFPEAKIIEAQCNDNFAAYHTKGFYYDYKKKKWGKLIVKDGAEMRDIDEPKPK